jgi:hypothetical protein
MSGHPYRENRDSKTVKCKSTGYRWIGRHDLKVEVGSNRLLAFVELPRIKPLFRRRANAAMLGQLSGVTRRTEFAYVAWTRKESSEGVWIAMNALRRVPGATNFEVNIDVLLGLMVVPG